MAVKKIPASVRARDRRRVAKRLGLNGLNGERARLAGSLKIELEKITYDEVRTVPETVARIEEWAEREFADARIALTRKMRGEIERWLDNGFLPPTIAKNLGISQLAVRKLMKENRWIVMRRRPVQLLPWQRFPAEVDGKTE